MADATKDRATVKKASAVYLPLYVANMPAAEIAYFGVMKAIDANGRAVNPSGANAALKVMGVVKERKDNSAGVADEKKVELESGGFKFANSGVNPVTIADIGKTAYAEDNQTVGILNTAGSEAGKIVQLDSDGVWVEVGAAFLG